jgi:hypothetical protein
MSRKKTLPSPATQRKALIQKKILTKDGRNQASGKKVQSKAVIQRLYKFYITDKNPASRPYFEAYSLRKRTLSRIEREGSESSISTPRGRISGTKYVRDVDTRTGKTFEKSLPPEVSIRYGRYYKTVQHVRDEFTYRIRPSIRCNQATYSQAARRAERIVGEIVAVLRRLIKQRGSLYRDHDVGAIVRYRCHDIETRDGIDNPVGYCRVPWITVHDVDLFNVALSEAFETALNIVFKYPGGSVSVSRVDVYVSTKWRSTNLDLLRVRE